MTGEHKNIDQLFRNGLKGMHEKTPLHAWNRLDQALDGVLFRKKMFYYKLIAASALILLAFGAGFFYATILHTPADVADQEIFQNQEPTKFTGDNPLTVPLKEGDDQAGMQNPELSRQEDSYLASEVNTGNSSPQVALITTDSGSEELQDPPSTLGNEKMNMGDSEKKETLSVLTYIQVKEIKFSTGIAAEQALMARITLPNKPDYDFTGFYPLEEYESKHMQKDKRLAIGAQFAPTQSYREISTNYNSNSSINQGIEDNLNDVEEALHSYAGGVNVDYNFAGNWSVQSGMYYSRIGQVNSDALQFKQTNNEILLYAINTSTGNINIAFERVPEDVKRINSLKDTIDMGSISNVKVVQNFDLFEIPLVIKYKFLNRRLSMNLSGGLSPAYLLGNNTYLEMEDRKYDIGDAGNLNSMIVNTSLGLGVEYLVTKKLSVNFEPTFKYSLNPINNNSDFSYHPYYFSWFTGIRLRIN